jgi:hypothetical protein
MWSTPEGSPDPAELRSWTCRNLLAEDARWAMDVILSAGREDHLSGHVPLLMGHHFVRIAYEGAITVRSNNPKIGVPAFAVLLQDKYAAITARARHLTKLLDNTKRSNTDVLSDLASEMKVHHEMLVGKTIGAARWLATDLGLYDLDRAMVGATIPITYRLGIHPTPSASISAEELRTIAEEWGGTLVVLGAVTLDTSEPTPTLDLSDIRIGARDRLASKYLPTRFDPEFPPELKALLLLVEGDLNTARLLLPRTSPGHEGAVFRARVITAYHCLSALQQICDAHPTRDTPDLRRVRSFLSDKPSKSVLSPGGARVRNRSVHYEINDPAIVPDPSKPMYGLVEAVYPQRTWEAFDADVRQVINRGSELLADWKP